MIRLVDRNRQIPGGLKFLEPSTKWQPVPWSSFSTIVDGLVSHRRANAYMAAKNKWNLDRRAVEDEVDEYNAKICQAHGWTNFIVDHGGGGLDLKSRSPHSPASGAAVGIKVMAEMFGSDGPIRDKEKATKRAKTCIACPKHDTGDWTRLFTKPAQAFIMKTLGLVKDLDLKTDLDDNLKVCAACGCPMKGKVWARIEHILKHIPAEDKAALDPKCWILAESALTWKSADGTPMDMTAHEKDGPNPDWITPHHD